MSEIVTFDHLKPEANAMALAMYSRDPRSINRHIEHIDQVGPEKFMSSYYVGYGHKSIGNCGTINICIENCSMLAAKAIQNNRLYNGQEASTRYLDMSKQGFINPLGATGEHILHRWMELYNRALEVSIRHLKEQFPILPDDSPTVYEKAIKAKAFDIARGFLPAGTKTYVGWHSTLSTAYDHLSKLKYHPLTEVREDALKSLAELKRTYLNSFNFKEYPETEEYLNLCGEHTYVSPQEMPIIDKFYVDHSQYQIKFPTTNIQSILQDRPAKTELPEWLNHWGTFDVYYQIDFGSFRDIQRHRSCTQLMPLLTTELNFHPWYLENLPTEFVSSIKPEIIALEQEINKIQDSYVRQYYIAMGYKVACKMTLGLPSYVYIAELRSSQNVHPTLRKVAQNMGRFIEETFHIFKPKLYVDYTPDQWSTKRGKQDIVSKTN